MEKINVTINAWRVVLFLSAVLDQCVHYEAAQYACGHHTHSHTQMHKQSLHSISPNDF